ncbi:hypothetical protein GOODEAATRI_004986 [Goodea atripinnis]|uniref:Uncharacterized protein n=1 Tax=Goodea atripinnis TaxID=208336 RepID=A0ABV0PBM7_9TELE
MLNETLPVTRVDFTAVLPRFLSLYVMSFLSPRDLCSRCIKRGWFLPYAPKEKEFGAWKNHYISCVSTLDWLTHREAAEMYGTLNQANMGGSKCEGLAFSYQEEQRRFTSLMVRLYCVYSCSGSFQNSELLLKKKTYLLFLVADYGFFWLNVVLSEWSGGDGGAVPVEQDPAAPALQYMFDSVLLGWCRQAQWMEEVLGQLRNSLELQLQQASVQARGRALGGFKAK